MLQRRDMGTGLLATLLPSLSIGCAQQASHPAEVRISLTGAPGRVVERRFLGFSYEKNKLASKLFDADDKALVGLFRALGDGVLRVGANAVDHTAWQPNGSGLSRGVTAPPDIARLAGFARATGWGVIYGVNLGAGDAVASADEAAVAAHMLGSSLLAIEIGNEPDIFSHNGLRARSYSYGQFSDEWRAFADAIRSRVPGVALTGPATGSPRDAPQWTLPFAADHGAEIALLTQHYYRANGQLASSTVEFLLQSDPALPALLRSLDQAARAHQIPLGYRLAEANSYYNGGAPNVSNSFGGGLWLLDFLIILAREGASGVNLHGGGNGPGYTPIADAGDRPVEARPEYAAMLLFAKLAGGRMLPSVIEAGGLALNGLAVAGADGVMRVLLVNKDANRGTQVRMATSAQHATLTQLLAPSLGSPAGVTLAGQPVSADGGWRGVPERLTLTDGLAVDLPAASAMLVEF